MRMFDGSLAFDKVRIFACEVLERRSAVCTKISDCNPAF
jgi:hypothetical protein